MRDAEGRELDLNARLEEVDRDRRLLAAAWEQLEREQVEAASAVRPSPRGEIPPAVRPAPVTRASGEDQGPVSEAIRRQFEALRDDVRRRAGSPARGGSR